MAKRYICPKCQHIGLPGRKKRGSAGAEMFGWMVFPLGVPYTLWRMFNKIKVCKMCGHDPLIEEDSIVGQKMIDKIYGLDKEIKTPTPAPLVAPKKIIEEIIEKPEVLPRMDPTRPEKDPEQF